MARLLEKAGFDDIVLSAKASNVRETVEVNRTLARLCDYPLHIGVTEAGLPAAARSNRPLQSARC